jgi:hypothetical protein
MRRSRRLAVLGKDNNTTNIVSTLYNFRYAGFQYLMLEDLADATYVD